MSIEHLVDRVQAALEASGWLNCDPEDWAALRKRLIQPVDAVAWIRVPNLDPNERLRLVADGEEYEFIRPDELAALREDAERGRWLIENEASVEKQHGCYVVKNCWSSDGICVGDTANEAIDRARGVK